MQSCHGLTSGNVYPRSMGSTRRTFLRPQGWKDKNLKATRTGNRLARRLAYLSGPPGSKGNTVTYHCDKHVLMWPFSKAFVAFTQVGAMSPKECLLYCGAATKFPSVAVQTHQRALLATALVVSIFL